jgi:membrane protein DedA with SNARE-associated domain
MPDWLTDLFACESAYLTVAAIFVLCGIGLPLPEEILLVSAGYLCHQGHATYAAMTIVCASAILLGDVIPFSLGRYFGPRLLRLSWVRLVDHWFRRRGDWVILIARFVPGLRVVAFFTGGTMRMRWTRFLLLDTLGIVLVAPAFVFVGWHFGNHIDDALHRIQKIEQSILILTCAGGGLLAMWYWTRRRARRLRRAATPRETFVGQRRGPASRARPSTETVLLEPTRQPSPPAKERTSEAERITTETPLGRDLPDRS